MLLAPEDLGPGLPIESGEVEEAEKVLRTRVLDLSMCSRMDMAARTEEDRRAALSVHLPGWNRHGHEVLDILEDEGVNPSAVVLSHMNPCVADMEYQRSLARRSTWLSFDMLGTDWYFGHLDTQAPSDDAVARGIAGLYSEGFGHQLLISCDTFLKMQLRRYGGPGYDHVPQRFVPAAAAAGTDRTRHHRPHRGQPSQRICLGSGQLLARGARRQRRPAPLSAGLDAVGNGRGAASRKHPERPRIAQ